MRITLISLLVVATVLVGCSSTVPKGMSEQDAKDAINRMSPEDKIIAISRSPMPQAEKEKKYKEIEAETGVKASDVLKSKAPTPGGG